ncbi:MAG: hypothetical protein ACR2HJ_02125 [Fimbriimonadales bacterium]
MKHTATAIALFLAICANAQWTVINLHPEGGDFSYANGVSDGQQVGLAHVVGPRASLWYGTAESYVDLHPTGAQASIAYGVSGGQQVGTVGSVNYRAALWTGTAESRVNLHPAGAAISEAFGVAGGQQVGYSDFTGGRANASLWTGTAQSHVNLHPAGAHSSVAQAIHNGQQVGYHMIFGNDNHLASLWSGTAQSHVSLHPAGATTSVARGIHNGQQVGVVDYDRASLWTGTAESWVDLGYGRAHGVHDGTQVGNSFGTDHACLWYGTPGSRVDLGAFLPPEFYTSEARGIWHDGVFTYVVGLAHVVGRDEAVMWVSRASAPTSYSMFRGSVISGNLASLQSSDNNRLVMRPGAVFSNAEPPVQVILNATAPTSSPSGFSFSLESNASIANAEQKISLYNYVTGQYEVLDTRLATTSDDTVNVSVTTNTSRFIQAGTMAIRARVSYRALGPVFTYPWFGRIDKAWWAFPG